MTPSLRSQFTHNWFPRSPVPEFGLDLGLHRKASCVGSSLCRYLKQLLWLEAKFTKLLLLTKHIVAKDLAVGKPLFNIILARVWRGPSTKSSNPARLRGFAEVKKGDICLNSSRFAMEKISEKRLTLRFIEPVSGFFCFAFVFLSDRIEEDEEF